MSRIAGAMTRMLVSRQLILVASAVGMLVLARLLTPADFGIYATVLAVFVMLEILVRFGLSEYLISARRLSIGMARSALGVSLALTMATIACGLLFLLTPLSAGLAPQLRGCLMLMFAGLAAIPFIVVPEAILQRRLDFGPLAWMAVAMVVVEVAVAIGLAAAGAGAVALVAGLVSGRAAYAAILLVRARRMVAPRLAGWRRFASFSPSLAATSLLAKSTDLALVFIIPATLGMASMGLYNRATTTVSLLDRILLDGIGTVVLPAMSDRLRAGLALWEVYNAKVARLTILVWPVFAVLALMAEPVVLTLLGEQWTGAVPVVRLLCAVEIFSPFTAMSVKLFVAIDRVEQYLRIQAWNQLVRVSLVLAAAMHSLEAVAGALVLAAALKTVLIHRALHGPMGDEGKAIRQADYARALVTVALSLAGPALLLYWAPGAPAPALAVGAALLAGIGWLAGVIATRHRLLDDLDSLGIMDRPRLSFLRRLLR